MNSFFSKTSSFSNSLSIAILTFFISFSAFAQVDYAALYQKDMDASVAALTAKDMPALAKAAADFKRDFPQEYEGYAFMTFYHLSQNELDKAEAESRLMQVMRPVDQATYSILAMLRYMQGNSAEAEKLLYYYYQTIYEANISATLEDIAIVEQNSGRDLSGFADLIKKTFDPAAYDYTLANNYFGCKYAMLGGDDCPDFKKYVAQYNQYRPFNPDISLDAAYAEGSLAYARGDLEGSRKIFREFIKDAESQNLMPFRQGTALYYLSDIDQRNLDQESAWLNSKLALQKLRPLNIPLETEARILESKVILEGKLEKQLDQRQTANELLLVGKKLNNFYYQAVALNSLGTSYFGQDLTADRAKMANYFTEALAAAKASGNKDMEMTIRTNNQVVLFQQGKRSEAIASGEEIYRYELSRNNIAQAANVINNTGFMQYYAKDYAGANASFKKSIDLVEQRKAGLKPEQQLLLMNQASSAYSGLIMSLSYQNNSTELFEIQERNRSGYLREQLNSGAKIPNLEETKALIKSDEVLVMYSLASPGEVIINVITNNQATVRRNYPIDAFITMKKTFTDRAKQIPANLIPSLKNANIDYLDGNLVTYQSKEQSYKSEDFSQLVQWTRELLESMDPELADMRTTFLKHWYNFTLAPISDLLNGKKTVLISASNELHFLPFETFLDQNGRYFIEKFDVRYIPSVSVWREVSQRNYDASRKPIIAFGGATYQPSPDPNSPRRQMSTEDVLMVGQEIREKIKAGNYFLKPELDQMGFGGANYLEGTLREVNYFAGLSPENKIYTGDGMKESNIKALNASGELANYRFVHIATHGFTTEVIPELSGIMCTQPNNGDGKEDMFLLAPEIAKLKLKSDMAILSACSTGIGKLYKGEGFSGLNTAFMLTGANSTLLSLWPVNDFGTMLLMQEMYKDILLEDSNTTAALNQIKRDMATGKYGPDAQIPSIWAPFVLNGN
ncbi:MAG: CHAT domain-containing protein [Algoriphagus sp.]|uniref:CHAT domain-containing protein n=1 Tax=Algoriphagus sp. TaxID=1872435 RepID=UPI00261B531A|nr:CHAT domain-containing protein [Algoriphagus sp.]MDG1276163.1 CHAT domain-containing protein [Algoriphagus sp.]